jgi:hypothetical protein
MEVVQTMGLLDWFINRPAQFDPDALSDEAVAKAIDKAITLTNPRLKLVDGYQERLRGPVKQCVDYLRRALTDLPAEIEVSVANWSSEPVLHAFFARPEELSSALGHSRNLRTFFGKYPELDRACIVLGMTYNERHIQGLSLRGDDVRLDPTQTVIDFSVPRVRICGHTDQEVRRLLGTQSFEYLVAQAMTEISEVRSERQELEDSRNLIRARLRLLQQQGPGLGSVFGDAPDSPEQLKLESRLIENERQLEELGGSQEALESELDALCNVLENSQSYLTFERRRLRLNTLNVVVDESSTDVASDVEFTMAVLSGTPKVRRAFVIGRMKRSELPALKLDIANAERFL